MHIAVCDDNMADRHQLERLLKRESDKRASATGILFADSFGNCDLLLQNPMQYDVFFVDMCHTEGITGMDVVDRLTQTGVNAPIVLCCSEINYREYSFPENVLFLDKPIQSGKLSESIDLALKVMKAAEPLIELREDKNTVYVTESRILYAVEEGRYVTVTLTDGRRIQTASDAVNFFAQIEQYPAFLMPSSKVILNCRHIQKLGFNKVQMTDNSVFKVRRDCMAYAKNAFSEYHNG